MTEKTDNASLCFVFHYLDIFLSYLIVRNDHTKFVFIDTQGSWLDFQNCGCRFSAMLIPKKLKIGREFDIKIEGSNQISTVPAPLNVAACIQKLFSEPSGYHIKKHTTQGF